MMSHTVGTAAAAAPRHFTMDLPDAWWTFDLDPGTRDASVRRYVEEQARGRPVGRALLDRVVRMAHGAVRDAAARRALRAAGLVMFLPEGSLLFATTVVTRVAPPADPSADLAELLLPVLRRNEHDGAHEDPGADRRVTRIATPVLPGLGPVGRVIGIEDVQLGCPDADCGLGESIPMALMHTVVPVPHSREFLVISSATPNLSLTEEFHELFAAIGGSLRFVPDPWRGQDDGTGADATESGGTDRV
ncbi:hypothetical protein [Streptomyces clavuligerus]|uniref:Uncharacterized protein n=1 Tax=Streptomyces clavuligerus TaxID=1901 RepID=B5GZ86_STRCL|nr:hypothetical protein [Streptomyces clavuligerus]ANW20431.1 hypothetical protein BB341_20575 [Streptomyces clavuligerus]AXU15055.1 hypothetical protein D1794_21415 [Streptomyces clavuligerus]EDY51632.1 hypothetical protein SSCG_04610 [Streptomyces clavuligerus]EFG06601.1 Hypothetical protein SCLAV_1526 [Streptomyces clavuligerus]MBY6305112.1 hypothetical protein [Streptomyces clavuligerus]